MAAGHPYPTDVFSLAVTMFYVLRREPPFSQLELAYLANDHRDPTP